ncbi:hypothetical protein BP5796_03641 [Coleophoma crateriformis]|uniref:Uncharacterized protein n=1 Tax=Coleophoma crateriformis TaxID=565419 RepID=A0A3D8SNS3_9HELO|nr:hypothetical protein BP5796_03641 [Coleophoma crateriformis]
MSDRQVLPFDLLEYFLTDHRESQRESSNNEDQYDNEPIEEIDRGDVSPEVIAQEQIEREERHLMLQQQQHSIRRTRRSRTEYQAYPEPTRQQQQLSRQQQVELHQTNILQAQSRTVRESRVKDSSVSQVERESSLKVGLNMNLDIAVDLHAKVNGDVTLGLL